MIGILGSAFNPPTKGHADLIQQALESGEFEKIMLVPSFHHAFGKVMADYEARCQLVSAFIDDLGLEQCELYAVEHQVPANGPVYTYDLLEFIESKVDQPIGFILGEDNWQGFERFYKAEEIKQRWSIFVGAERKRIRSTLVREGLKQEQDVSSMVTPGVMRLTTELGLYHDHND